MLSIEKNKIIYTSTYDPSERQEVYPKNVPEYLSDIIEIGDFVTFARVFDIIIENKNIFNDIYSRSLGNHKIDHYINEYNKPYVHSKDVYDLEVYRNVELHKYDDDDAELEQYIGFNRVGNFEGDEEKEPYNLSLSFVPINNLKQRYIRVNNEVKIIDFRSKKFKSIPCHSDITAFEFFDGILNDISFFGTPETEMKNPRNYWTGLKK